MYSPSHQPYIYFASNGAVAVYGIFQVWDLPSKFTCIDERPISHGISTGHFVASATCDNGDVGNIGLITVTPV
jgi:hypothetical protein